MTTIFQLTNSVINFLVAKGLSMIGFPPPNSFVRSSLRMLFTGTEGTIPLHKKEAIAGLFEYLHNNFTRKDQDGLKIMLPQAFHVIQEEENNRSLGGFLFESTIPNKIDVHGIHYFLNIHPIMKNYIHVLCERSEFYGVRTRVLSHFYTSSVRKLLPKLSFAIQDSVNQSDFKFVAQVECKELSIKKSPKKILQILEKSLVKLIRDLNKFQDSNQSKFQQSTEVVFKRVHKAIGYFSACEEITNPEVKKFFKYLRDKPDYKEIEPCLKSLYCGNPENYSKEAQIFSLKLREFFFINNNTTSENYQSTLNI